MKLWNELKQIYDDSLSEEKKRHLSTPQRLYVHRKKKKIGIRETYKTEDLLNTIKYKT